ncbi:hypothetical protein [Nocardia vaccinii]|uniref:hypothetical protein n=1 Tax=Nocardia vaccinii TaxID=1822 RepID=UPI00083204E3|nr:hypothetical protein [Nocardia vaccinii]
MNEIMKTLLDAAQLPAAEGEIASYAAGYADQRAAVDALYAVPEARYAAPALHFRAASRIADWAS